VVFANLDSLEVEALPGDLPPSIKVDISKLATIGAAIHVKDLTIPEGVKVLEDPEEIVVVITSVQEEKEPEVAVAEVEEEPEVIEKGKKEEEEEAEE
jgi:large subunit ribosomal protein L25